MNHWFTFLPFTFFPFSCAFFLLICKGSYIVYGLINFCCRTSYHNLGRLTFMYIYYFTVSTGWETGNGLSCVPCFRVSHEDPIQVSALGGPHLKVQWRRICLPIHLYVCRQDSAPFGLSGWVPQFLAGYWLEATWDFSAWQLASTKPVKRECVSKMEVRISHN